MSTSPLDWNEELKSRMEDINITALPISLEDIEKGYSWLIEASVKTSVEEQEAYKKELFDYLKGCKERGMPLYYSYSRTGITVTAKRFIESELKKQIEEVCLLGPKVLNGIAPTQAALDSFLADFGIFPVFSDMTFITRRRIPREVFDAFHYDDPNQFIPQEYIKKALAAMRETAQPALRSKAFNLNNKNILASDPEILLVLAGGPNASELNTAEKTYKRTEVQQWRNDAVSACIDIANRFNVDSRAIAEFKKLIENPTPVEKKDE